MIVGVALTLAACNDRNAPRDETKPRTMNTDRKVRLVLESPIGIATLGSDFTSLIPAGRQLPVTFSEVFANAEDGQKAIEVALSQKHSDGVEMIATIVANDLPPRPKGTLRVLVTLTVSTAKELKVKVTVTETGFVKEYGPFPVK